MYDLKIRRRNRDGGSTVESHTFHVDVKSLICPVAMMHSSPETRELIDIHSRHESAGIGMFEGQMPSWGLDFQQVVSGAEVRVKDACQEKVASL